MSGGDDLEALSTGEVEGGDVGDFLCPTSGVLGDFSCLGVTGRLQ